MDTNDWNDAEQRVERAQELFDQRKWQEALDELLLATTINPYNAGWFFNIGLTLDEMGRLDEAIDAYRRALKIEKDDVQALHHLGTDLQQTHRFAEAIETFEQIEAIDPSIESAYCGRILCYSELDQHEKAEEMFYLARLYRAHCPACYFNMGCSLADRGLYDKAIFCWTKTLDFSVSGGGSGGGSGGSGSGNGGAIGASSGGDNSSSNHGDLGTPPNVNYSASNYPNSEEFNDLYGEVHVRIAQALWSKGELEDARQHFVLGLRQDPGNTGTLLDLSDLLVEMDRWEEAGEKIRRAIELAPEDPAAHFCFGRWLLHRQRDERAIASLKRSLELDPTWPGAHLLLGEAHYRRKELPEACQHLRAELLLRPDEPQMLMDLANLLIDVGETRPAVACLKRLTQLRPEHTAAWQNLGVAHCLRGRYDEGIGALLEALRLDPKNRSILHNIALAHGRLKRFDTALKFTRRGLALQPPDPALDRLDFRLRVLRLHHRMMSWVRRCNPWPTRRKSN